MLKGKAVRFQQFVHHWRATGRHPFLFTGLSLIINRHQTFQFILMTFSTEMLINGSGRFLLVICKVFLQHSMTGRAGKLGMF